MSLRGYLFVLIGGLIALLTIVQIALVYWIENNLAREVDIKARQYSEQVIELAVEQFDSQSPEIIVKDPKTLKNTWKFEQKFTGKNGEQDVKVYTFNDNAIIDVKPKDAIENPTQETDASADVGQANNEQQRESVHINKKVLKHEFKTIIDKIHKKQLEHQLNNLENVQTFVVKSPNMHQQTWVSTKNISPSSQALFEKIKIMLLIVAVIGVIFAFWLSAQFNKPLKLLAQGFDKLSKGDYQHKVPATGVKEIRTTIQHFNNLVERLEALSKAEQQNKELAHLAELGEVSRGLAHALRNPIHTIGLSIEQLEDNNLDDTQKQRLLATIQHKIHHLDKSIKALLTLTANGIERSDNVPLLAVIQDIILEYKSTMQKSIQFELAISEDIEILGAESEIRSILHTLINNACEASLENSKVAITAQQHDGQIKISVKDVGNGLEPHIEKQLFQPHISSKPEGAGMGLYIANRLVTLHYQGSLTLTNNADAGCTATVTFGG